MPTAPTTSPTLTNLITAFNGESNAHAKYTAFAAKAQSEGFLGVASLFRAAASAEKIHAIRHAQVIRQLSGNDPVATFHPVDLQSTAENLKVAIAGECYERDEMYPAFIAQAVTESNAVALRTFKGALAAEIEHAILYQTALDNLPQWTAPRDFYICPVCGFTESAKPDHRCPVCNAPAEKFAVVN